MTPAISPWHGVAAVSLLLAGWPAQGAGIGCSRHDAVRATVPQVAGNPEHYENKCVVIDGVMSGRALFESVDGVYLRPHDLLNPASSGFRLGLDRLPHHLRGGYQHVSVLGRVQDCERIRDLVHASAGEDEVVMVVGYCHSHNGAYVNLQDVRYRSGRPFVRQMGSYQRRDYGDIAPAPENWPHRPMIEGLAAKFLSALRANDAKTLADIHFRNVGLLWEDDEAEMLAFLLKDPRSPFTSLRNSSTDPQTMILLHRTPLDFDAEDEEDPDDYTAIACFCRTQDCTGRWPIASFDADNLPSRPYACTSIEPYASGHETLPHFRTLTGTYGLAEPPSPAR